MSEAQDTLLSLAEVSVALAGFAAIIVVLRRGNEGKWTEASADQFHGMVMHALCAFVFCLVPMLVDLVVQDVVTTFHICAALLGTQIILHSIGVMFMSTTELVGRLLLSLGLVIGALQFTVFTDWGAQREFVVYTGGIIWHVMQAGVLFVLLVWIPRTNIE